MKQLLRTTLALAILVFGAQAHSYAQGGCDTGGSGGCPSTPEIDPTMASAGLVLLGGAALIIRSRSKK